MFGPVYGLVGPVYGSGGGSVKVEGGSVTLTGAANGAVSINGANVTHSTVTNDGPGLVPALPNDSTKFLDGKGNWSVINTGGAGSSGSPGATYSVVTSSKPGLVPALPSDGKKFLDGNGNWSTINAVTVSGGSGATYSTVTTSNPGLVPALPSDGRKFLDGNGNWSTISAVTVSGGSGSGATYSTVTTSNPGLVPVLPDDSAKFLDGKGNWSTISTGSGTSSNINLVSAKTAAGTVNTTSESGNTFINLTDNNNVKSSIQIIGDGNVSVSSSTAGVIKIFGSSTSANTGTGGSSSIVQKVSTANAKYPILLSGMSDATSDVTTDNVIFGSGIQVNPQDSAIIVGNKITINGGEGAIQLGSNVLDPNTANVFTGNCSLETAVSADSQTYYTGEVYVTVSNPKFVFQKGSTVTFKTPELDTNILANSTLSGNLNFHFGIDDNSSIKTIKKGTVAYNAASMKNANTYTVRLQDIPKDGYYVSVTNNPKGFLCSTNTFIQPVRLGGTGATTAEEARKNLGLDQITGGGTGGGWARIAYDAGNITNSQYVISVTNDNLTLTMGTLMCIRFDNFKSSNDSTPLFINLNNTGNKKILINGKTDAQVKDFADNYYYTFMYSGSSWVMSAYPKVPVELGGTGADNAQDALANLGISTVSSDMALQALGLDNVPPGVFICGGVTMSENQQTFFNDANVSPMLGFKLVPGVQIFIRNLYTSTYTGGLAFNFNDTGKKYVATFTSAGAYKAAEAADFGPGFYHAVYVDKLQGKNETDTKTNVWIISKMF